jgi:hypothetical protein
MRHTPKWLCNIAFINIPKYQPVIASSVFYKNQIPQDL